MIIAVNTRFMMKDRLEGYGYFTREVFSRIAAWHPEHHFYFLFDRPFDADFVSAPNVTPLVVPPPARHPLLWKWWYDFRVPSVLKKIRADMFVSPDGHCSLATRVPQCMVMHDIGIIHFPGAFRKLHAAYYKWYVPKFLEKARVIATVSEFSKNDIVSRYGVKPEKLQVVFSAARPVFRPVSAEVREKVKETWTGGREYFIYVGAIQPRKNVTRLLKAFSLFKKRQKTEMKLVLAGRMAWKNDTFIERLKTYKYRDDVVLTGYLAEDELVRLTASAYALVYPSLFEGFGVPVLEGMQCDVPVLTSGGTSMQEIGDDAALYFDPSDPAAIAEQMMRIYKDEDLRARLVARGRVVSSRFTWDRTAQLVWESMMRGI